MLREVKEFTQGHLARMAGPKKTQVFCYPCPKLRGSKEYCQPIFSETVLSLVRRFLVGLFVCLYYQPNKQHEKKNKTFTRKSSVSVYVVLAGFDFNAS